VSCGLVRKEKTMAQIKTVDVIGAKWATVTPQRTGEYESGVKSPRRNWQQETVAAKGAYVAGVQASIASDAFTKGVNRAGQAKWQEGAVTKGVQRFGPGVQQGQDAYIKGFAPYREAISRISLPPRFGRRDPRNLLRVTAIADALGKVKAAGGV